MVNIALANQNTHSQCRKVIVNIATGICTLADGQEIELKRLMSEFDFSHPLLTQPFIRASSHEFHYEYDDIDGLLSSAIYVYATLLQVDKPLSCQFKINPSSVFQHNKRPEQVYFSINGSKVAQESISLKQLEDLVSHLSGYKFEFSEDVIIDEMLTIDDLPPSIDGDLLCNMNVNILDLLKVPKDLRRYELRYISPAIGFGVFSREKIKTGEVISIYSGLKKIHKPVKVKYAFETKLDCLKMYLDARQYGNISRFINHAPSFKTSQIISPRSPLLVANITADRHYLNGIEMVVYTTIKDIAKGEQLLVDYGELYFTHMEMIRFKENGKPVHMNKKTIRSTSQKKINQIRAMADSGVKKAQMYLLLRLVSIVGVLFILMGILNYFF